MERKYTWVSSFAAPWVEVGNSKNKNDPWPPFFSGVVLLRSDGRAFRMAADRGEYGYLGWSNHRLVREPLFDCPQHDIDEGERMISTITDTADEGVDRLVAGWMGCYEENGDWRWPDDSLMWDGASCLKGVPGFSSQWQYAGVLLGVIINHGSADFSSDAEGFTCLEIDLPFAPKFDDHGVGVSIRVQAPTPELAIARACLALIAGGIERGDI